ADLYAVGVADRDRMQVRGAHLQQREIARPAGADELRRQRAIVGEVYLDFVSVLDDVIVREDIAVGGHDDAGSERALTLRPRRRTPPLAALAEAIAELVAAGPPEQVFGLLPVEAGRRHP